MSNVTLSIGGRSFTVACAEGEEGHVAGLGRMIDSKVGSMGDLTGQSEPRMLLFAALLLADELHELKSAEPAAAPAPAEAAPAPSLSALASQQLESIASRLENLASRLEGPTSSA
ncbi:MAG: cell division protein ZapA [Novosphingobium sp.]|nr:cell division protein ZapA [Novosphingobium sp.]MCP5402903.1 cell division protein ZapA [Novosphingobium sp.]